MSVHTFALKKLARDHPEFTVSVSGQDSRPRRQRNIRDTLVDRLLSDRGFEAGIIPDAFCWTETGLICIEITASNRCGREKLLAYSKLASLLDELEYDFSLVELSVSLRVMNVWDTFDLMSWDPAQDKEPPPLSWPVKVAGEYLLSMSSALAAA